MQFLIPVPSGETIYKPNGHSREELKYAFKQLRKKGHGKGSILLFSIYGELWPKMAWRGHQKWLKQHSYD